MLLRFAEEAELLQAFQMSMLWGALVVVVTTVLMKMSLEGTKSEIRNSTAAILGCMFYLFFSLLTYKQQYGSFTAAEVGSERITLHFAGSYFSPLELDAGDIATVEVGHPGKGVPQQCYLNLRMKSGESYRSAPASNVDCESYRKQVEMLLAH